VDAGYWVGRWSLLLERRLLGGQVGYYGGINYGFGYFGTGFWGGYWRGGRFMYTGAYNHCASTTHVIIVAGFDGRPGGAAFARATLQD